MSTIALRAVRRDPPPNVLAISLCFAVLAGVALLFPGCWFSGAIGRSTAFIGDHMAGPGRQFVKRFEKWINAGAHFDDDSDSWPGECEAEALDEFESDQDWHWYDLCEMWNEALRTCQRNEGGYKDEECLEYQKIVMEFAAGDFELDLDITSGKGSAVAHYREHSGGSQVQPAQEPARDPNFHTQQKVNYFQPQTGVLQADIRGKRKIIGNDSAKTDYRGHNGDSQGDAANRVFDLALRKWIAEGSKILPPHPLWPGFCSKDALSAYIKAGDYIGAEKCEAWNKAVALCDIYGYGADKDDFCPQTLKILTTYFDTMKSWQNIKTETFTSASDVIAHAEKNYPHVQFDWSGQNTMGN